MDLPRFISSPRGKGRGGYGGFVYLRFAIEGFPKVVFHPHKKTDDYD
jgi:hypothetical protein